MSLASAGTATTARPIPAPRSIRNRHVRMALLLPAVSANSAGFGASIQRWGHHSNPARKGALTLANKWGRKAGLGLCHPTNQSHDAPAPALSMESIAILVKPSL